MQYIFLMKGKGGAQQLSATEGGGSGFGGEVELGVIRAAMEADSVLVCVLVPAETHPEWVFIQVRRLPFDHLYGHDAQGPDVHFGAVGFAGHHLWSHPVRRPDHRTAFTLFRGDLGAEAKVSWENKR